MTGRARRPRRRLTKLDPDSIVRYRNFRNGRLEIWGAKSADHIWTYERVEVTGTPWQVTHEPTGRWNLYGNLGDARAATYPDNPDDPNSSSPALRALDALDAEQAQRNAEQAGRVA